VRVSLEESEAVNQCAKDRTRRLAYKPVVLANADRLIVRQRVEPSNEILAIDQSAKPVTVRYPLFKLGGSAGRGSFDQLFAGKKFTGHPAGAYHSRPSWLISAANVESCFIRSRTSWTCVHSFPLKSFSIAGANPRPAVRSSPFKSAM
jgi:hypothetical protein